MYTAILGMHILGGSVALLAGLLAILTKKGQRKHMLSGRWFYVAMQVVGISALMMSSMKWNAFLFSLGILSLYFTYAGRQSLRYWRQKQTMAPRLLEKLPAIIAFLTGVVMIAYPTYAMIVNRKIFIALPLVFGLVLVLNTLQEFRLWRDEGNFRPGNRSWLLRHISMMGAAYISTVTAFLVVNINEVPMWMPWLLPTVVGTMVIFYSVGKWRRKLSPPGRKQGIAHRQA